MTAQIDEIKEEQLEKALSEMDGLDSKDKDIYRIDNETFRFKDVEFKLIEDYREAFDMDMMEERFTDYLLKYDYIVGDIAYEKLRLRGFFEDYRKGVPIDMKISHLEDYLIEYCSFGCPYFVFERIEKKKADPESYFKRNKKSNPRNKRNQSKRNPRSNQANKNKRGNTHSKNQPSKKQPNKNQANHHSNKPNASRSSNPQKEFQVVKKEESKPTQPKQQKQVTETKQKGGNQPFEIRKKKDE